MKSHFIRRVLTAAVAAAAVIALGACGSSAGTKTTSSTTPTTSPTATTSQHQSAISGMGATLAEFKAVHGQDMIKGGACSAGPYCFGADIKNDEDAGYQVTGASIDDGIVDGYTQAFLPNTTLASAESQILQWMPKDAKMTSVTIDHHGGSCAMANISSATLARLFSAPKIGDPKGIVGVELGYIDANLNQVYNPNNIQHADLSVLPTDPSAAC